MRIFRRREAEGEPSLEETEANPELLAAEEAVNRLPDGPPSSDPASGHIDAVAGPRPRMVSFPPSDEEFEST